MAEEEFIDDIPDFEMRQATYKVNVTAYDDSCEFIAEQTATSFGTPEPAIKYAKDLAALVEKGTIRILADEKPAYIGIAVDTAIVVDGEEISDGRLFETTIKISE